jgi:protein O-GlcNAc transferase
VTVAEALKIGASLQREGRLGEAEAMCRKIIAEHPDVADAQQLLGTLLYQQGKHREAVAHLRQAIALEPGRAEFFVNLSAPLGASGDLDGAIAACEQAAALNPQLSEARYNLHLWHWVAGRERECEAAIREAIRLRPEHAEAHCSLGNLLAGQDRVEEASAEYEEAIRHRPDFAEAHYNLANMLVKRDRPGAALAAYRVAVRLRPGFADAHFNLGNTLHAQGELDAAAEAYAAALRAEPKHTGALWHLGNVWKDRGRIAEAIPLWRRSLLIEPDDAALHSTLALYLRYDPATAPAQIAEEEARWNESHAGLLRRSRERHLGARDPQKRLRIGYVSPDFWDHAVGRNVLPLLENHDRAQHTIFCYSAAKRADALTERLRAVADGWRDVSRLSDEALAARIREDEVDVLVDLALHTGGNRLLVFARQPAPVQFSFAGYPGGTGVETIAHRISDPHLEGDAPPSRTTHLIDSFWCFDPVDLEIPVSPLPASECGRVTFACLNNACKINDAVLALWAEVLRACRDSRLLLLSLPGSHRALVIEKLSALGVAAERVEFVSPAPRADYMRHYHRADVMLDSSPYGGHTTSLEALWMGVPLVTLPGAALVSRAGLSQLRNLDLPELIARDAADFVRIATDLAHDLPRLAEIRRTLRPRMEHSVLMDAARFARGIEAAYRAAWRQWCEGSDAP